jgi:hypothetical protein
VFSGVERNSLTWDEIKQIADGFTVLKTSTIRFFKNFNSLNIIIKNNMKISIEFNVRKSLISNRYLPIKINIKFLITLNYYLKIIRNKIIYFIKKYNLNKIK